MKRKYLLIPFLIITSFSFSQNITGKWNFKSILPESTQISWDDIIFKGLQIKGIYGREMYETWYKMTQMLRSGLDISKVLTHKLPVHNFKEGFEIMESGNCGKVLLEW